jgi:hypothetical protein
MNEHEDLRDLSTDSEELKRWQEMTPDLARLPCPPVPAWLAQRTSLRVKQAHEEREERRWNNFVLAFLVGFSWVLSVATWPIVQLATGARLLPWLEFSLVFSWITAGSAAVILGLHRAISR